MVLYKKAFPLGAGMSFSSYIKALGKKKFPNYYLRIEKIPSTIDYHGTLVFTVPNWEWGLRGPFSDGVLLKECIIKYSEGEKHFTIQASARIGNFFLALFMIAYAVFLFVFEIFQIITYNTSLNEIFILAVILPLISIPPTSIYLQDKFFLDTVGSLGREIEKNN